MSLLQDSELIEADDNVLSVSVWKYRDANRALSALEMFFQWMNEWMHEGVRQNQMKSSENQKPSVSLTTGETEHQTSLLKTTHYFFLNHHCLRSGALARNQGRKYVDVCLQGCMYA